MNVIYLCVHIATYTFIIDVVHVFLNLYQKYVYRVFFRISWKCTLFLVLEEVHPPGWCFLFKFMNLL